MPTNQADAFAPSEFRTITGGNSKLLDRRRIFHRGPEVPRERFVAVGGRHDTVDSVNYPRLEPGQSFL